MNYIPGNFFCNFPEFDRVAEDSISITGHCSVTGLQLIVAFIHRVDKPPQDILGIEGNPIGVLNIQVVPVGDVFYQHIEYHGCVEFVSHN